MTVIVKMGHRVPKSWKSRIANTVKGLIGFQENIWIMMKISFETARKQFISGKKAPEGRMDSFTIEKTAESEDTFWKLEWLTITIQGDEKCEEAEFTEANNMYKTLKQTLRNKPKDVSNDRLKSVFKTKMLSPEKIKEAYNKGYGAEKDKSISNILLEMGILTHIEWIKDFEERSITPDF